MINDVTCSKTVWVVHAEKTANMVYMVCLVRGSLLIAVLTGVHLT